MSDPAGRTVGADGDLQRLQREWDQLADLDALWAVLSYRRKKFGRWDHQEFFADGARQVDRVLAHARDLGHPHGWGSVLDFGCGVGRLAPALASSFGCYLGVDISNGMVQRARRLHAARSNCTFVVSGDPTLGRFTDHSFDLIITFCVLQHIPARTTITAYLSSFCRLLREGGLLAFQLPAHIPTAEKLVPDVRRDLYERLGRLGVPETVRFRLGLFPMTMNDLPEAQVLAVLESSGGKVLDVCSKRGGFAIRDRTYYVTRAT